MDSKIEGPKSGGSSPIRSDSSRVSTTSDHSLDRDLGLPSCRVCQCVEPDKRGETVLGFLGIEPPQQEPQSNEKKEPGYVEFVSPTGEVFVCNTDIETGPPHRDMLIELGCACKNDLALVHYACALKWFVNHGSTICEICGRVTKNIRSEDFKRVISSLKDYEALRERTASGVPNHFNPAHDNNSSVDPDAVAAIRRQRLTEISLWFNPHNNNQHNNNNNSNVNIPVVSSMVVDQQPNVVIQDDRPQENPATKWAVEGTGILLATGLLTITLAWLIAPRVGKKTAKNGLHILLGGVCALAVVVFFRFVVLTRIRYGPARYWAILFVFWFLVFGIWASRTHGAH